MTTLFDYVKRLKAHNWDYQDIKNPAQWQAGQKEHESLIKLSYTSPEHRKAFLKIKKEAGR